MIHLTSVCVRVLNIYSHTTHLTDIVLIFILITCCSSIRIGRRKKKATLVCPYTNPYTPAQKTRCAVSLFSLSILSRVFSVITVGSTPQVSAELLSCRCPSIRSFTSRRKRSHEVLLSAVIPAYFQRVVFCSRISLPK